MQLCEPAACRQSPRLAHTLLSTRHFPETPTPNHMQTAINRTCVVQCRQKYTHIHTHTHTAQGALHSPFHHPRPKADRVQPRAQPTASRSLPRPSPPHLLYCPAPTSGPALMYMLVCLCVSVRVCACVHVAWESCDRGRRWRCMAGNMASPHCCELGGPAARRHAPPPPTPHLPPAPSRLWLPFCGPCMQTPWASNGDQHNEHGLRALPLPAMPQRAMAV
jgi:hypothetical protein